MIPAPPADAWVFGYGSLMWDPGFPHVERRPALLRGWHRAFSLKSTQSWGAAARPGLVLALHAGGACRGVAFRVVADRWPEVAAYLRRRENAYRHVDVQVDMDGARVPARTFAFDPAHPRSIGKLPFDDAVGLIAQGRGRKGSSHEYLRGTVQCLESMGAQVGAMLKDLLAAVDAANRDSGC